MEREQDILDEALELGRRYAFDEAHARQVARFSLELFDQLGGLHELGGPERQILLAGALLHDVGKFVASRRHHKHSHYIISNSALKSLDSGQAEVAAVVARYHRRARPSDNHAEFDALSGKQQDRVRKLAALLRIADALDSGHAQRVDAVRTRAGKSELELVMSGRVDLDQERRATRKKCRMFEKVYGLKVRVKVEDGTGGDG